ncbi:unnamed protein product [Mesocestoides corti]|uniref:MFS domain-containing protein n=1 Tax=Mesocestoides corti TaxID=53468 RepID=A0A0R3U2R6_MESCO|nr:unnamed protein product [Mesocestoides corti]
MNYEADIEIVHGKGIFCIILTLCLSSATSILAFEFVSIVFLNYAPNFTCIDGRLENLSRVTWISNTDYTNLALGKLASIPDQTDNQIEQCYAAIQNASNELQAFACSKFSYDGSVMYHTFVTDYNLVCDRKAYANWLTSATMIAIAVGHLLAVFTDKFSRRKILIFYMVLDIFWSLVTPFVPNLCGIFICRIMRMLSIPLCYLASCLLFELLPAEKRTVYGNCYWAPFTVSYIATAGLAYLARDWRTLRLYGLLGLVGYIPLFLLLPESPRWLCLNGKYVEYRAVLAKLAKWNKATLPENFWNKAFEGAPLASNHGLKESASTTPFICETGGVCEESGGDPVKTDTLLDAFRSPNLRKILLVFCVQLAAVSSCYYGLSTSADFASDNVFLNVFYMGLSEVPSSVVGWLICRRFDRRGSFLLTSAFVIPSLMLAPILRPYSPVANILIISTGKLMVTIAYNVCLLHITEVFPTTVRNMGLFFVMAFGCAISGLSPFINELRSVCIYLPSIVYAVMNLLAALLAFYYLPNTKHCPMAQTISQVKTLRRGREQQWIEFMVFQNNGGQV